MTDAELRHRHVSWAQLRARHIAALDPAVVLRAEIINVAEEKMEALRDYYGGVDVPERILRKLDAVKREQDLSKIRPIVDKAVCSMLIHMLALWAQGVIRGHPQEQV